jgi:FKBP-type peptidyl-prolyl cis-trans isomerase FklB
MKKISLIAIAVLTGLAFSSCNKSGGEKLASKTDTISYALGSVQGARVKTELQKDTAGKLYDSFVKGFKEAIDTKEDSSMLYYSFGLQVGAQMKMTAKQGFMNDSTMPLNADIIKEAFLAALKSNKNLKISSEEASTLISELAKKKQSEKMEKQFGSNKLAGEKFLAENKTKEGVVTLPDGLQYKVIKQGNGPKPTASDKVKVNYIGKLIDGKVFDSSVARKQPATFPVTGVIKGWSEVLQLMPVGSKWEVFVPQELAYGADSQDPIPPFSTLVFEVELLSIEK